MWLKIKIWTKVALLSFVTIYLLTFIFKNSDEPAKFWYWFWRPDVETSILYFTLFTFAAGVLTTILVRMMFKTVHQVREMRNKARTERLEREVADMKAKAAMLQTKASPPLQQERAAKGEIPLA
jgi:hypothetical protein